jgi:hypothetical protein
MTQFQRGELWAVLALVGLLLVLSIVGAFLGAATAAGLFNSWPLIAFWLLWAFLFIAGLWTFQQLHRRPASLAMHAACLLILAGAMWGSVDGHKVARDLLGEHKVPSGFMRLTERAEPSNLILSNQNGGAESVIGHLPFSLRLDGFRIVY